MAYNTKELFRIAKDAIVSKKLIFVEEVVSFLPCDKTTFYNHFRPDSNDFNELKDLLTKNRVEIKASMRSKWYRSNAPVLQVSLYKLLATPEEHKALQMQYNDHTTNGKDIAPPIKWIDGTDK